jgi:hypothetical protein
MAAHNGTTSDDNIFITLQPTRVEHELNMLAPGHSTMWFWPDSTSPVTAFYQAL